MSYSRKEQEYMSENYISVGGKVMWFNKQSGYGIVKIHQNNEYEGCRVFVHRREITTMYKKNQPKYLKKGEDVEFYVIDETPEVDNIYNKQLYALNIVNLWNEPLACEKQNLKNKKSEKREKNKKNKKNKKNNFYDHYKKRFYKDINDDLNIKESKTEIKSSIPQEPINPNTKGWTALHFAANEGNIDVVWELMKGGYDRFTLDEYGTCTASQVTNNEYIKDMLSEQRIIEVAVKIGDVDYVNKLLVEERPFLNHSDTRGRSLLYWACRYGHLEIVKVLFKYSFISVNIDSTDNDHITPLHIACINNRYDVVKYLLANGVSLHMVDNNGCSPLHYAVYYGFEKTVWELLKYDFDIELEDINGNTPLSLANDDMYCLLTGDKFMIAAELGDHNMLVVMREYQEDINCQDQYGWSALHWACYKNHIKVVKALVIRKNDIDLNIKDLNGITPLHEACYQGNSEIVDILLNNGAKVLIPNGFGSTPLNDASCKGHKDIVRKLLAKM